MDHSNFRKLVLKDHCLFRSVNILNYNEPIQDHFLPGTGKIYFTFYYGSAIKLVESDKRVTPEKLVVEPVAKSSKLSCSDNLKIIKLELNPQRWFQITKIKAKDCNSKDFDISNILGHAVVNDLHTKFKDLENPGDVIQILDRDLGNNYNKWTQSTAIDKIIFYIFQKKGKISIAEIINKFNLSKSSLYNYFNIYIGVSPKFYIRLVNFNRTLVKCLNGDKSLAEIIREDNYHDYSHFQKDFEQFTGTKISKISSLDNPMLRIMLQNTNI